MSFLIDSEIKALLKSDSPPIIDADLSGNLDSIDSQIQPCSTDLRISEIFQPCDEKMATEDSAPRMKQYDLRVGQSVKVTTIETLDLGNQYAGLFVAPARLTRKGIVLPDVGHIDPGFKGKLRITLINMGRHPHLLKHGDSVATILLSRLASACEVGLRDRSGDQPYDKGLEDIRHLSPDFLDIESRAEKIAKKVAKSAVGESGWRLLVSYFLPIVVGLCIAGVGYYTQVGVKVDRWTAELKTVKAQLNAAEKVASTVSETRRLEQRIDSLERRITPLITGNQQSKASASTSYSNVGWEQPAMPKVP